MPKRSYFPKTSVFKNTFGRFDPVFLFQITFLKQKRMFSLNSAHFSLFKGKQNILHKKPNACKNCQICLMQVCLSTHEVVLTLFFVLNHQSNSEMHVFHQIVCISACYKWNKIFYTRYLTHKNGRICLIQVFLTTHSLVLNPSFVLNHHCHCTNACFSSNSVYYIL